MTEVLKLQFDPRDAPNERSRARDGDAAQPVYELEDAAFQHVPTPLRGLIVDDSSSTRRLLRGVLEHSAHFAVVGEANDGDMAIELAKTLQPDFVLLDLSMPYLDGASALGGLVQAAPDATVIIVSGADPSAGEALLPAGATAFVPKGIAPHELLMRLGSILGRWVDSDRPIGWEEIDQGSVLPAPQTGLPPFSGRRAVIRGSDPLLRRPITEAFERCNVSVVAETDKAVTRLANDGRAQPEFVVVDHCTHSEPIVSVLTEIWRRSPQTIVLVYSDAAESKELALEVGAAAFVQKPQIDELCDQITNVAASR